MVGSLLTFGLYLNSATDDTEERDKVKRAGECCRKILNYVNQAVKEAENKQVRRHIITLEVTRPQKCIHKYTIQAVLLVMYFWLLYILINGFCDLSL